MATYTLNVNAHKEVEKYSPYSSSTTETVSVTKAELFEAVSKYLQVKGFDTEALSVEAAPKSEQKS